jgi:phage anti-repressor protein
MEEVNPDIVNIIEKNPIVYFNKDYQNKFIHKIQEKFTGSEQQMFISSFYCYLNYNKQDFIIDMENIWRWLGFSRKEHCKVVLKKHFSENTDYVIKYPNRATTEVAVKKGGSGILKETVLMNITTFKKLCLKSNTKRADEIHDYFIKLEETIQEVINEESSELRNQLLLKEIEYENDKNIIREKNIIEYFPENTQCVYYGLINNKTENGESVW